MTDVCVHLRQQQGTARFADGSILADIETDSLGACVGACTSASGCAAVAVEKDVRDGNVMGKCILAGSGYATVGDSGFYLYDLVMDCDRLDRPR